MKEVWKDIAGYEGLYQVSNLGRVKRIRAGRGTRTGVLKYRMSKSGYGRVFLWKNGVSSDKNVHRLVAEAFLDNTNNKPQVNHKNGIKSDNRVENLEWVSVSENALHSAHILGKSPGNWSRKKVRCVETGEIFESQVLAAEAYNTSQGAIGNAARGNRPKAGEHRWEFV